MTKRSSHRELRQILQKTESEQRFSPKLNISELICFDRLIKRTFLHMYANFCDQKASLKKVMVIK